MADQLEVYLVSAARTPIGRFQGTLKDVPAAVLGGVAVRAAVARAGIDPAQVDEVIMGHVVQAGAGQAPARQAALLGGLPETVSATTINKVCGSGLKAIMMAANAIRAGDGHIYVCGGMESMDMAPYLLPQARSGYRLGNAELVDAVVHDGLWCAFEHHHMGNSAEWVAREYKISRAEQDEFSLASQQKALAAQDAGRFRAEIVPVEIPQRKGPPLLFAADETPRRDSTRESLARLRPAFVEGGTVTAGNAPGLSDGAAALVVMSGARVAELGLTPLARITGYAQAGVKPLEIFTAPIYAVRRLLERTNTTVADYDLIEVNEAFAAQVLADGHALGWDWERVNVNGGAIALGHPIGCSGARVVVTLIHALQQQSKRTGLASLCLGGGEAVALSLELVS
ncbi:acetyl-CoA C-acetyltransferase [Candidatus Amarolinea dominans]|uniref:acetyl-CoA C-acetyltransferase n=1 Tax=Candidatus Amarolinea dominans TaxID=3140696 RepID=UPI00313648D9|nr:acetyl-CoA C-acetyltransferase [Anaerolineae bacterium]MBK9229509.1 acetyl-CoA C-acetyltransferase [Anaerolineae bacterium]